MFRAIFSGINRTEKPITSNNYSSTKLYILPIQLMSEPMFAYFLGDMDMPASEGDECGSRPLSFQGANCFRGLNEERNTLLAIDEPKVHQSSSLELKCTLIGSTGHLPRGPG